MAGQMSKVSKSLGMGVELTQLGRPQPLLSSTLSWGLSPGHIWKDHHRPFYGKPLEGPAGLSDTVSPGHHSH